MIKYLLLCLLAISQSINGRPAHSLAGDLASHILIVTPQAQVHLEPALKYEAVAPTTFIQHLSPLARIAAPHDETIIYVPSGAAVEARSSSLLSPSKPETKQYEQIQQQIEQAQAALQEGTSVIGPQLSEAASAAASAASSAGTSFFPALFPPAAGAGASSSSSLKKDEKLKADKIEYETIRTISTGPLIAASSGEARRYYALTPAVSHVIDFVHAPVFLGPVSAVRARSIPEGSLISEKLNSENTELLSSDGLKSELDELQLKKKETSDGKNAFIEIESEGSELRQDEKKLEIEKSLDKEIIEKEKLHEKQLLQQKEYNEQQLLLQQQQQQLKKREDYKEIQPNQQQLKQSPEIKPLKDEPLKQEQQQQQPQIELKPQEKNLESPKKENELKEKRDEEEKKYEEKQPQEFLKENLKKASARQYGSEKEVEPQQQRISSSDVAPVQVHHHHHHHEEEVKQQQKSVGVVGDPAVVPVFVPQSKAV